jgi:hypothetical protein
VPDDDTLAAEKAAEDSVRDGDADHLTDEELSHEVEQLPGEDDGADDH